MKCPKCGSTKVVEIVYGLPTFEASGQAEKGEIFFGGCDQNIDLDPQKHCNSCGCDFLRPIVDPNDIRMLSFTVNRISDRDFFITIKKTKEFWKATYLIRELAKGDKKEGLKNLNQVQWFCLWWEIEKCFIWDWENTISDKTIPNGDKWELKIKRGKSIFKRHGIYAYPPYYMKFTKIIDKYIIG